MSRHQKLDGVGPVDNRPLCLNNFYLLFFLFGYFLDLDPFLNFLVFRKKFVFLERSVMQLKTTIHVNELVDEMNALKM